MKKSVFIDGQHGTTGLKIVQRLALRDDIEIMEIPPEQRKDTVIKKRYLNDADIVFLCLPDDAARESVAMITNPKVKVIDPSTAHRTAAGWVYGIPELHPGHRKAIAETTRLSNPGCYATGFVLCVHPLVTGGIMPAHYPVNSYAITGYSGGGKQMIQNYEAEGVNLQEICSRPKNLNLAHKHLPEMKTHGLLQEIPLFVPIVGNFYNGMLVFIPIHLKLLTRKMDAYQLRDYFEHYYAGESFVKVIGREEIESIGEGFVSPVACNDTNRLDIFVFARATGEQAMLVARLDNLGKGASGAAIQNMNLMLGVNEGKGL